MIAIDLGSSSIKRFSGGVALPDLARGSLRTPAGLVERSGAAAIARLAQAAVADAARVGGGSGGCAVVVPASADEREREQIRAALLAGGFADAEVVPAPVAIALADATEAADRSAWIVVDAGHAALRAHLVRWHRLGERRIPRIERTLLEDASLGGLALDRALAREAWVPAGATLPAADELSPRGFYEVKELAASIRGPLARRVALEAGVAEVEVPGSAVKSAFVELLLRLRDVAPALARMADEAQAARIVAAGGLLDLAPFRTGLGAALGERLAVLAGPLSAASRGALRALESPIVPRADEALSLLARRGSGLAAIEVVPKKALLPGKFGPVSVEVAVSQEPLELAFVEGEGARLAVLPRRPVKASVRFEVEWSYDAGWRLLPADAPPVPLAPAPARSASLREALAFDFGTRTEATPLDVLFVFVATKGEGVLLPRAVEGISALARRASERAHQARFAAVAVGDHPQGGVKPRYVTLPHPFGDLAALEKFCADQAKDPVDGVDAPEAIECALARAAEAAWRPEAEKVVYVLTDVPPHEKAEAPFCPVDWRDGLKKLRGLGATVVPVLLEGGALAPDIARRTRSFLDALKGEDGVLGLRGKAGDPLLATIDRLAARRRLDPLARDMLGRVAVSG